MPGTHALSRGLVAWLSVATGADQTDLAGLHRLAGGAVQENWKFDVTFTGGNLPGRHTLVFRLDPNCPLRQGNGREQEFAVQRLLHETGFAVAEPLFLDSDGLVAGRPGYVMRWVRGSADPCRLVDRRMRLATRSTLAEQAGRHLAALHRITPATVPPERRPPCLAEPPAAPALHRISGLLSDLDALPEPLPALEWTLRQLRLRAPASQAVVLGHGDYRVGNIMVEGTRITGVLDWEFASWSDPLEDVGWFCARCWRHGADRREAGGLGERADFTRGYERGCDGPVDWSRVPFWEALATARWAVIAHHQAQRAPSDPVLDLELALTGRKAAELEYDALVQTENLRRAA